MIGGLKHTDTIVLAKQGVEEVPDDRIGNEVRPTGDSLNEAPGAASVLDVNPSSVAKDEHDQEGPKVNFDLDIDNLRKMFVAIISDYAVRQEASIERLLFSRLGSLCDFFGSKGTMDNIIPLLGTCSNRKDFLVKLDCLKSVVGVGIKVGKQTLAQYMLLIYI